MVLLLAAVTSASSAEHFTYETNGGAITITGYIGPGGEETIPPTINDLPVVAIASYAFDSVAGLAGITIPDSVTSIGTCSFQHCSSLASVVIGEGVKSITYGAFFECLNLTSVTLPNGLTDFQTYAFRGCSALAFLTIPTNVTTIANSVFFGAGLTNIAIPKSVTSIGSTAFCPCSRLQAITVDPLNPAYSSVDGALFNKSRTTLIQCPGGKPGAYIVPDTVTTIGDSAFSYCGELTNVTLGTNVTTIGNQAFISCLKLASMTLTDKVTSIGTAAFAYNAALTNVTIGKAVAVIGSRAFASCTKLTGFTVDLLNSAFSSVDGVLFNKSQKTLVCYPGGRAGRYVIPNGVTNIAANAFESSINLTGVVIPRSVTIIPAYAFAFCTALTNLTIPATVTTLADRAFVACSTLSAVFFCGKAPSLGSGFVFYNANLASLYYLPGATNWSSTFGGRPAFLWNPTPQTDPPSFGVLSNAFGFTITGTTNIPLLIEASSQLPPATWTPLQTCTLTNGSIYFRDQDWTNEPARFYRIRSP